MSAASQNHQLLWNGEYLLNSSLSQPAATGLKSQYGFPIPFIPNLNSSPENNTASMVVSEAMSFPTTPATLEKNKMVQDCRSPIFIDLVDEQETYQNIQRNEFSTSQQPIAENPADLCFSNLVMSSQIVASQQQKGEMNALANSSSEVPLPHGEIEKHIERENQGIDLNMTPQQKPKRKKHRPKVIREGKPAKTPKPVTPKPVTPRRARTTENPSGKRKYVRKKKNLDSPEEIPSCGGIVNPNSGSGTKSVRRSLNFDLDDPCQPRDGCPRLLTMMFTQNASESHAQEACDVEAAIAGSSANSTVNSTQEWGAAVSAKSMSGGITVDLNSSMNEFTNEYARILETPNLPPQPSRQGMNINQSAYVRMLNNLMPQAQLPSRRERENLKALARKNNSLTISGNCQRYPGAGISHVDSNKNLDLLLKGAKRGRSLVDDPQATADTSFIRAYNGTDSVSQSPDTSRNGPCYPKGLKKQRTENGQHEVMSNASSVLTYRPSSGWTTVQVVKNTSEVFTFADAQRFMALEKVRASKQSLVFEKSEWKTINRSVQAHSSMTCTAAAGTSEGSVPVETSGHNNLGCNQPSTPEKPSRCKNTQETDNFGPHMQIESPVVNTQVKPKARRRKKKEQEHLVKSMPLNVNQVDHEQASCKKGPFPVQQYFRMKTSTSLSSGKNNSHPQIRPVQDCQSSSNHRGSVGLQPGTAMPYGDVVDDIIRKLKHLNITGGHEDNAAQLQNALVPYVGGGMIVPFESPFDITKKRRPRPKVDLDPESNRVWKLLMGKESSEHDEAMEMNKEKWWEEERRVFRGRADSFIARMHLVQGDRRFSQWKGSVVDSVIGVFLTQNVSDHLSSSAFMSLAARFPLQPGSNDQTRSAEKISRPIAFDDTRWQGKMKEQDLCSRSSFVIHNFEEMNAKEIHKGNYSLESDSGGGSISYSKINSMDFHGKGLGLGHESPDSGSGTAVTVTSSTGVTEGEDKRSHEDVVSSQNSVVSSQNSSECAVQASGQGKVNSLLNFEADDLLTGGTGNGINSFMELLQMANCGGLQEVNSHGNGRILPTEYSSRINQLAHLGTDKIQPVLNQLDNPNGAVPSIYLSDSHRHPTQHDFMNLSCVPSPSYYCQDSSNARSVGMNNANELTKLDIGSRLPSVPSGINKTNNIEITGSQYASTAGNLIKAMEQHKLLSSKVVPPTDSYSPISKNPVQPITPSKTEFRVEKRSFCQGNLSEETTEVSSNINISGRCSRSQDRKTGMFQQVETEVEFQAESSQHAVEAQSKIQNCKTSHTSLSSYNNNQSDTLEVLETVELNVRNEVSTSQKVSAETVNKSSKDKKVKAETEKKTYDWDILRKQACATGAKKTRSSNTMDSIDYEAIRCADVNEISYTIRERGMNNMLAERIKDFLNRIVRDHGSIDLEWLRDVPPDKAKDYLLSVRGLGLKSVECVRLLTLHHLAFPVDTNVGRICVRLGWVPLQPLPESLQLHLLEMYPVLETIQKYLWPRLCKLDQRTLYELHYQMITFGKVFCTKSKPNCNACPMRGECKHFASAFASARLALPGPEEKGLVNSTVPIATARGHAPVFKPMALPQLEGNTPSQYQTGSRSCEPIIEEPASPEPECIETSESAIEDAFYDDPDEIPTIKLNLEEFTQNLQNYMQENNMELQDGDMSKALVAITPEAASIPTPKLKNVSRLRTEHQVYELPDSHPLLIGLDQREPDDPCPYLLAIWTPGETAQSTEPPKECCSSQDTGKLCDRDTCFSCNSIREAEAQMVRGTLLIPCRTAMRGSFPLNGTYFQVNEVFADHHSSRNPIDVPRNWIWNLPRRTVYFGTSIPTIFKGLTTEGIQHCFWRGFVCVRGFDRTNRAPRPLYARLHFPASKVTRNKKTAAAAKEDEKHHAGDSKQDPTRNYSAPVR